MHNLSLLQQAYFTFDTDRSLARPGENQAGFLVEPGAARAHESDRGEGLKSPAIETIEHTGQNLFVAVLTLIFALTALAFTAFFAMELFFSFQSVAPEEWFRAFTLKQSVIAG